MSSITYGKKVQTGQRACGPDTCGHTRMCGISGRNLNVWISISECGGKVFFLFFFSEYFSGINLKLLNVTGHFYR